MAKIVTREDDERVLHWVRLRASGMSSAEVARIYGVSSATVRIATNAVVRDDRRRCGAHVLAHYWIGSENQRLKNGKTKSGR